MNSLVLPHLSCTSWIKISRETRISNFEDKNSLEISSSLLLSSSALFYEQKKDYPLSGTDGNAITISSHLACIYTCCSASVQ